MARRSGRPPQIADPGNSDSLGVGALAEGELAHGERGIIEDLATAPAGGGQPGMAPAGGAPQPSPPQGGAAMDLFGPTTHPDEPMQAGLPGGPGAAGALDEDPDEVLRVIYQAFPHPDIARLLESRDF